MSPYNAYYCDVSSDDEKKTLINAAKSSKVKPFKDYGEMEEFYNTGFAFYPSFGTYSLWGGNCMPLNSKKIPADEMRKKVKGVFV